MKKLMKVMSAEYGDRPEMFDTTDAAATAEARALFERIMKQGGAAFEIGPAGETKQRVRNFEELGEQNILVPKYAGG